jgi:hypothetical protein
MIILSETTDKLQVVLAGSVTTNQLQCFASWRDRTSSTFVAGRTAINTNNVTDVDLVSSPASSTQRIVDFFTIFNKDTVNATVTVKLDANGVEYILFKATLATGEALTYQEGVGFMVFANSGAAKHSINQGNNTIGSALTAVVLGNDVINNNATLNTMQDVTGLSFTVIAGSTYYFRFIISYTAALSTTGSRWAINGPAFTRMSYMSEYTLTTTTSTRNAMVQAYDSPAASNASSVVAQNHARIEGIITPSNNGTVIARFASEIANSAITAKAGSVCYYQQTL